MPSTSPDGFPYPALGDPPHGPNQLAALANAVQAKAINLDAAITAILGRLNNAASATVATSQDTASTSYTDLATVGPSVTLTSVGTLAFCWWSCLAWNTNELLAGNAISVAVSGATTIGESDSWALKISRMTSSTGFAGRPTAFKLFTINPGSNTYRLKYKQTGGTGTFVDRELTVWAP
ncbi:MAG TPA: hypothetical protein VGD67_13815 [Pseudonocardiaceae bacterium]